MQEVRFTILDLLLMTLLSGLSAAILVPFFAGYFPPLMTSLFVALFGFFLAGAAVGTLFRKRIIFVVVAMALSPFVIGAVDALGLGRGYTTPTPLSTDDISDDSRLE